MFFFLDLPLHMAMKIELEEYTEVWKVTVRLMNVLVLLIFGFCKLKLEMKVKWLDLE